jgi:hypothetical protein
VTDTEAAEIKARAILLGSLLKQLAPPGVGMKSKFVAVEIKVRDDAPTEVIEGITQSVAKMIKEMLDYFPLEELQGLVEFEVLNGTD